MDLSIQLQCDHTKIDMKSLPDTPASLLAYAFPVLALSAWCEKCPMMKCTLFVRTKTSSETLSIPPMRQSILESLLVMMIAKSLKLPNYLTDQNNGSETD